MPPPCSTLGCPTREPTPRPNVDVADQIFAPERRNGYRPGTVECAVRGSAVRHTPGHRVALHAAVVHDAPDGTGDERELDVVAVHCAVHVDARPVRAVVRARDGRAVLLQDERRLAASSGTEIHCENPGAGHVLGPDRTGPEGEKHDREWAGVVSHGITFGG